MKRKLLKKSVMFLFAIVLLLPIKVFAANEITLLQSNVNENTASFYLNVPADGIKEITGQVGMSASEKIEFSNLEDEFQTIVMLDNSLSITKENKAKIYELLELIFSQKKQNERMTLITFGEDYQTIVERSDDAQVLIDALQTIEHNDQDTYLTDVLYELLNDLDENEFTRFIIISDGVDNKAIGITTDELNKALETNKHPVYTIGHIYGKNNEQLKMMFSISRLTNGTYYLLDELEDLNQVSDEIVQAADLMKIDVEIPHDQMDGSEKNVLLKVKTTDDSIQELSFKTLVPFALEEKKEPEVIEKVVEKIVEVPVVQEEVEPVVEEEPKKSNGITKIILLVVVIIAAVVLLLLNRKKSGKPSKEKKVKEVKEKGKKKKNEVPVPVEKEQPETVIELKKFLFVLRDTNNPQRVFKYPLINELIIGRDPDTVQITLDYSDTISGHHCKVINDKNIIYIMDMNSTNHTYVDGTRYDSGRVKINTGSIVRMGELTFSVEILPL